MAEITTTQSFSDGDTVTATKLNNIQGNASIQPEAITNRTAETTIDQANDLLLMYDASSTSLKKITPSNLIKAGTASDFPITGNATIGGNLSVTGDSVVKAGTAASPAIQPTGDANTGIFFPAADTIAFSEGGAEAMRINSSGQVGIGSSSPNAKLFVNVGSTPNKAQLLVGYLDGSENYYDANTHYFRNGSAAEAMRILETGSVGIGTTSPSDILHVSKANGVSIFESTGVSSVGIRLRTNSTDRWQIGCPNASADLAIYTGAAATERLRIDSSGNVGIGTASPTSRLHLGSGDIRLENGNYIVWGGTSNGITGNAALNLLSLYTNATERLRIDSSGNVLIGATDSNVQGGNVGFKFVYNTTNPYMGIVADLSANSTNYHLYNKNATNNGYRFYVNLNGGVTNFSANNTNLSDERLKTNISPAGNYLDKICSIPVKTFNYKDQGEDTEKTIGIIAQDVEAVIPELINNDGFGETPADGIPLKTIYQTDLQYALMKCIQELKSENDSLKSRIEVLEAA